MRLVKEEAHRSVYSTPLVGLCISLLYIFQTFQMPLKAIVESGITDWCLWHGHWGGREVLSLKSLLFTSSASGFAETSLRRSPRIKQLSFIRTNSGSFYSVSQPKSRSVQRLHSFQQKSGNASPSVKWMFLGKGICNLIFSQHLRRLRLEVSNQGDG